MRKYYILLATLILQLHIAAQNTGIGTNLPKQKLDVNGAIKIGTTNANEPGSIRYTNNQFEGGDGSSWRSLEGLPATSIIMAQEPDTSFLKTQGFSVLRTMDIWDTSFINVSVNTPGAWSNGFPLSAGTTPTATFNSNETVQYNGQFIYYGGDGFLYSYNTATDVWLQLPGVSPLGLRNAFGMTLVGNEVFITGGWRFVNPNFVIYNTGAKYNLLTNTWTAIANMPVTNCFHATVASGTDLYFINGSSTYTAGNFVNAKKLYRYNTVSNTWSADLATPGTPDYISPYVATGRNGKYIFCSNLVNNSSGNQYVSIAEFNPATQTLTNLTPPPPGAYTALFQFRNSKPLATTTDKVLVVGYLPDTADINYNPLNPDATTNTLTVLYEVTVSTGISVQHNPCKIANEVLFAWQYNAADQQVYVRSFTGNYLVFNKAGTESCNIVLRRKGYWSYMKKN